MTFRFSTDLLQWSVGYILLTPMTGRNTWECDTLIAVFNLPMNEIYLKQSFLSLFDGKRADGIVIRHHFGFHELDRLYDSSSNRIGDIANKTGHWGYSKSITIDWTRLMNCMLVSETTIVQLIRLVLSACTAFIGPDDAMNAWTGCSKDLNQSTGWNTWVQCWTCALDQFVIRSN